MSEHYPGGHRMQDCPTQADSVILRIRTPQDRYRYLIRDQDSIFAKSLDKSISTLGIRILKSPPQSPTANAICERVIGTIRRECVDWMIPLSESHSV
jgi:putative transposase